MLEKRTVIDQRIIERDGKIFATFEKQIIEDGAIINREKNPEYYHMIPIDPGADLEFILSENDKHLQAMKFAAIDNDSKELIRRTVLTEHTEPVITAYQEKVRVALELSQADAELLKIEPSGVNQ